MLFNIVAAEFDVAPPMPGGAISGPEISVACPPPSAGTAGAVAIIVRAPHRIPGGASRWWWAGSEEPTQSSCGLRLLHPGGGWGRRPGSGGSRRSLVGEGVGYPGGISVAI